MAGKWGVDFDTTSEWEETRINRSRTNPTQASENDVKPETLLVDAKGRPLVVKEPRSVGFRPPKVP